MRISDWSSDVCSSDLVTAAERKAALNGLSNELRDALELAAERIAAYHEKQKPQDSDSTDAAGVRLGARWRAVDAAGLYVPGGRAAYPSLLLMNAIPGKGAGVEQDGRASRWGRVCKDVVMRGGRGS